MHSYWIAIIEGDKLPFLMEQQPYEPPEEFFERVNECIRYKMISLTKVVFTRMERK